MGYHVRSTRISLKKKEGKRKQIWKINGGLYITLISFALFVYILVRIDLRLEWRPVVANLRQSRSDLTDAVCEKVGCLRDGFSEKCIFVGNTYFSSMLET